MEDTYITLSDEEINAFFDDLDLDKNGYVTFEEASARLHQVYDELAPDPIKNDVKHPFRRDLEENAGYTEDGLDTYLAQKMPGVERIDREDFVRAVKTWRVPSQKQTDSEVQDIKDKACELRIPFRRRVRAYWAVHGHSICFIAFVVALQTGIGLWQGLRYLLNPLAMSALGWGLVLAKICAGILYPTFFFMLLSMSRHFPTLVRKNYHLSRLVNWDHSQAFHITMCVTALFFSTLHAIGHMTGTFWHGSRPQYRDSVERYLDHGTPTDPWSYDRFLHFLPSWTGLFSLALFWIIALLATPFVRKRHYEIFQLGHLLMFPFIGLISVHGASELLQAPMLGYWISFPAALVFCERAWRLVKGLRPIPAKAYILDNETTLVTCKHPMGADWRYSAGQYVLLQVPSISFFQWHPFTISACRGDILSVHIKAAGNWTKKLHGSIPRDGNITVAIDGPFGAPAQRFYDYDYSLIIGGGIGVTPFSAILADMEFKVQKQADPWTDRKSWRCTHSKVSGVNNFSRPASAERGMEVRFADPFPDPKSWRSPYYKLSHLSALLHSRNASSETFSDMESLRPQKERSSMQRQRPQRRVDFHWTVRESNSLLWFSDLLNRTIDAVGAAAMDGNTDLELNINTYVTMRRKNISTHIFRYLLDRHQTCTAPYSALTGLKQASHFGRPDFQQILSKHFDDLIASGVHVKKVGVFYCGSPVVGKILSDNCQVLTARARHMGLRIRYYFLMEVFGG